MPCAASCGNELRKRVENLRGGRGFGGLNPRALGQKSLVSASLLFVLTLLTFSACGKSPRDPVVLIPKAQSQGAVSLRVPDPSLYRQMEVQTWMGHYPVRSDGSFDAEFPEINDVRFTFVSLKERPHDPLYYGYFFPPQYESERLKPFIYRPGNLVIDARSTALTMVLVNPLLFLSTVEQRALIAERALQHPQFRELVAKIEDLRSLDPTVPIRYSTTPDLFFLSSRILIDTMKQIAEELPDETPANPPFVPQGINYDYDMAYPQNTDTAFKFVNPKMAHYVAGAVVAGDNTNTFVAETYIPGKERWLKIDISIFPPKLKIEVVPPVEVDPEGMNEGAYILHIYKGFQFDLPFSTLWNTPPARKAMVANVYAAWAMMIALAADLTEILVNVFYGGVGAKQLGGFIRFLDSRLFATNNQVPVQNLWNTVQTRDRIQTINSMYDVFVAVLPAIQQTLEDRARELYGDAAGQNGILSQIGTIFSGVWSLVSGGGIVNAIIDITTQIIPFYYDLFTAHGYAAYPVFNLKIQELPNNPTISRIYPVTVFNGKNASAVGFGFGGTPGKLYATGARNGGNPYEITQILAWSPSQIIFRMPEDEQGKNVGGQTVVYFQITTSDLKTTNTYMAPFRYVQPGQDSGGGCSIARATPRDNSHAVALLFLLVLPGIAFLLLRRRGGA